MGISAARKMAIALKWTVTVVFVLLLALMVFVPYLANMRAISIDEAVARGVESLSTATVLKSWALLFSPSETWLMILAWFMLFCGACGAVILWQARIILKSLGEGRPFIRKNIRAMLRAGVCCFAIAAASAARLIWSIAAVGRWLPLVTYTALFVPVFVFAGLLCLVAASLFSGAADLKEDSDLVI